MASRQGAATPARATRARSKTPLPALGARQSHAYGARGKAELHTQVKSGKNDLLNAFSTGRTAPAREGSPPASESMRAESEIPEEEPEVTAPVTAMDASAAYAGGANPVRRQEIVQERPATPSLIDRLGLPFLCLLCIISGILLSVMPLPMRLEVARHNIASGLRQITYASPFDIPPADLADRWFRFQHDQIFMDLLPDVNMPDLQWHINVNFLTRLQSLERRVASLEGNMTLTQETLVEIRRLLPEVTILRRVDDHLEIPEDFWQALQERMVEDSELAPRWRAWLLRNENQIEELQRQDIDATFNNALENGQIVTREVFSQAIQENSDWLHKQYSQELKAMWQHNMANIKSLAANSAKEMMDRAEISRYAKEQIEILTKANALHNAAEALRGYNFFSVGGGARINPKITSPTAGDRQSTRLATIWSMINPLPRARHAPIEALLNWEEATQCWCGTSTWEGGPVNLGIDLPHKISPERLIVEHVPALATLDIAAAPRELEVWADAGTAKQAKRFDNLIAENSDSVWVPVCGAKPEPSFVCVGNGRYDIHEHNHVQGFPIRQELGLETSRVIVRFNNNWGGNYTCIYRVRMTGTRVN